MTLEQEIDFKMNMKKYSQADINGLEGTENNLNQNDSRLMTKTMLLDNKMYESIIFPTYVLEKAFKRVKAVGSATAMVAVLNKNELAIANIGDSGFLVIRFKNGEPYCPHKSKE